MRLLLPTAMERQSHNVMNRMLRVVAIAASSTLQHRVCGLSVATVMQ